jgi:hypothetical protein
MTFEVGVSLPVFYYATTGSTVTGTLYDQLNNSHGAVTMTEVGATGVYAGAFTPDAAGIWKLKLNVGTTYLLQCFPVGFGTISNATYGLDALHTDLATVDGYFDVPAADGVNDVTMRDVIGKKDDAAVVSVGTTKSVVAYEKGNLTTGLAIKAKTDLISGATVLTTDLATSLTNIDLDHLVKTTAGAAEPTDGTFIDQIMHKDAGQTFDATTDSLEAIRDAVSALSSATGTMVKDVVVYLAAEDVSTTELTDNGSSIIYLAEVTKNNANEAAGQTNPAWTEDFNLEQVLAMNIVSVFLELEAYIKITGSGTGYAKWQLSNDGGSTWVDVTDNFSTTSTSYSTFKRVGVMVPFSSISAGANKFQARLCTWTGATSVESKVRSNSYVRITYRGS